MASKAVIDPLIGRNGERGYLFTVEWAQAKQIGAGALQCHMLPYYIFNWISSQQFINKGRGKRHNLYLLSITNKLYHIIPEFATR